MRKEIKAALVIAGAATLSGKGEVQNPDLHPTKGGSPGDVMSLPAEGMFRRDEQGNAFQVRDGVWEQLSPIDPGENVFDNQTGLKRLTSIQDPSAPESYRFSHFTSEATFNRDANRWEVGGCYATAGGLSCDAVFEVPSGKVDEINRIIDNQ